MASCKADITNQRGLHARAAAKFVKTVEAFETEVAVSHKGQTVSGVSIMGLMMLAAAPGSTIEIDAQGPQADDVLAALQTLIGNKFDEE